LKRSVLGKQELRQSMIGPISEKQIIQELATTPLYGSIDPEELKIRERAKRLLAYEPHEAMDLIFKLSDRELNPIGDLFLVEMSRALDSENASIIARERFDIFLTFVKQNPSLAASEWVWSEPIDKQRAVFEAFANSDRKRREASWPSILSAMLESGSDACSNEMVQLLGPALVLAVMNWFDSRGAAEGKRQLQSGWKRSLASEPSCLMNWLKTVEHPFPWTIELVSTLLDPNASTTQQADSDIWLDAMQRCQPEIQLSRSLAFLLALGFDNVGDRAAELASMAFEPVHDAIAEEALDRQAWVYLSRQMPAISWWRDWDKCEKLRLALADRFLRFSWPPDLLPKAVRRPQTFRKVMDLLELSPRGVKVIDKIKAGISEGTIIVTNDQKMVLDSYSR
jgi:hypothetical protein